MPEYFNNNGDQGNIEVLKKQLEWRGVEFSLSSSDLDDSDFLLVGDGSRAVMREFESDLSSLSALLQERLDTGKATLLVGSSHEYFCAKIPELPNLKTFSRVSEFREVTSGSQKAFGYRNTDKDLDLFVDRAFISTSLFGPVLAKNQNLLNLVLASMGVNRELSSEHQARLDEVLKAVRSQALGT
jgi:CobQ-like glutamine amidotransferase family enzyme